MKKAFIFITLIIALMIGNVSYASGSTISTLTTPYTTQVFNASGSFTNSDPNFEALAVTADGGYIAGEGGTIVKFNSSLQVQWAKVYSVSGSLVSIKNYMGGYVAVFTEWNSTWDQLTTVMRIGGQGEIVWGYKTKVADSQRATSLLIKNDGTIVVGGIGFESTDPGSFLFQLTSSGTFIDSAQFDDSSKVPGIVAMFDEGSNGITVISSYNTQGWTIGQALITRLSDFNTVTSSLSLEMSPGYNIKYVDAIKASDGDYVLLGKGTDRKISVTKVAGDLSVVRWSKTYTNTDSSVGKAESPEKILETPTGFIIGGTTYAYNADWNDISLILAITSTGDIQWSQITFDAGASYLLKGMGINGSKFAWVTNYYAPQNQTVPTRGGWIAEHPLDGNCFGCRDTQNVTLQTATLTGSLTAQTPFTKNYTTTDGSFATTITSSDVTIQNMVLSSSIVSGNHNITTAPSLAVAIADTSNYNTNAGAVLRVLNNNIPFAEVEATVDSDLDWTGIEGAADPNIGKAYVAGLGTAPGAAPTHSLLIPKVANSTGAYVCPQALTLIEVTENCVGKMEVNSSSNNTSVVTINGIEYWKVDGLTGTGGGNIIAAVNNNVSSSNSSTSSSLVSALLAATGLDVMQTLGIAFFVMGVVTYIYVARRKSHK